VIAKSQFHAKAADVELQIRSATYFSRNYVVSMKTSNQATAALRPATQWEYALTP
jgi:hypothetical protein